MSLVNTVTKFCPEPPVHENNTNYTEDGPNNLSNQRNWVAAAFGLWHVEEVEATTKSTCCAPTSLVAIFF